MEQKKQIIHKLNNHIDLLYKYMGPKKDFNRDFKDNIRVCSQLGIITSLTEILLPNYKPTIDNEFYKLMSFHISSLYEDEIYLYIEHIKDLIVLELAGEEKIEEGKVFLGAKEKLEQARKSYRNQDSSGLFSCLHTVIELILKDKLGIALDMDGARLGKVIGICIRNDVFPGKKNILERLYTNVCEIDNNIKHKGYSPSAKEINDALLITEQAVRVLETTTPNLSNEVIEKISEICIKNN